jgi:hypothetical protein
MKNHSTNLNLFGSDLNRSFIDGSGKDLFIAAGCSWTRGWGAVDDCLYFADPNFKDDREFVRNQSYAGLVAKSLGIDAILMLAIPGSNNETQARLIINFLQKNRNQYRRVFVLWGLTSHLRWELYSNNINAPSMFMLGSVVPPGKEKELKCQNEQNKILFGVELLYNIMKKQIIEEIRDMKYLLNYNRGRILFHTKSGVIDLLHSNCLEVDL